MTKLRLTETIHQLTDESGLPANAVNKAPGFGQPQREAINSVVDSLVADLCRDIGDVRLLLDKVEQGVIEGAAKAKHMLVEHVGVCTSVKDEITHMRRVVDDIAERGKRALGE